MVIARYRYAIETGEDHLGEADDAAFKRWRESLPPGNCMDWGEYLPDATCEATGKRETCVEMFRWYQEPVVHSREQE